MSAIVTADFRHERCQACGKPNPPHRVRTCGDACHREWVAAEALRDAWRKTVHADIGRLLATQRARLVARTSRR